MLDRLFDQRVLRDGGKNAPILTPKPKVWDHQIWQTGRCSLKFFIKVDFDLTML